MPVSYQFHDLIKSAFFCCVHVIVTGRYPFSSPYRGEVFYWVLSQVHKKLGGGVVPTIGLICKVYSIVRSSLLTAYIDKPVCYVHTTRVHYRTYSTKLGKYNQFSCDLCLCLFAYYVPPHLLLFLLANISFTLMPIFFV